MAKSVLPRGIAVLIVGMAGAGCSFYRVKTQSTSAPAPTYDPATLSYAKLVDDVLKPKCFACHSSAGGNQGGVNMETYAAMKSYIADMKRQIDEQLMPQGSTLPSSEFAELDTWLGAGGPENAAK